MATLYESLGGFDAILKACRRWHELCLADPLAAHPFEHGLHPQHDERLAAYLAEVTGGPKLYTAGYGDESSMQRMHAGNGDHPQLDERCVDLFDRALAEVGLPVEAAAKLVVHFRQATEAQCAYAASKDLVPSSLELPRWT